MNAVLPVLTAGATFAFTTLAGVFAGYWIGQATGQGLWVLGGLIAGIAIGGFSAYRLLLRSM